MIRYLRILRIFLVSSIQLELEYRANVVMSAFNALMTYTVGLVVLLVLFSRAKAIGGWSFDETLALQGVFLMLEAIIAIYVRPNLSRIPEYVRTGAMDGFLLKPISSQFMVSFRHATVWQVPGLVLGLAVLLYAMARMGTLAPGALMLALMMLACGAAMIYAIWLMLATTAFWLVRVDDIGELFQAFFGAGRLPASAYPSWLRIILSFVIPIAFITNVPAAAAVGRLSWPLAGASVLVALVLLVLAHLLWRHALASYTSASS